MADLHFRKYTPADAAVFKALNMEWLETYFEVEEIDERVLSHPDTEILTPGGYIFMVENQGEVVGTFAYIKKGEGVYEFSKMAVYPSQRGKGIGNKMMQFALRFAEQHHWERIILYSSTRLENSIHIYRKYGFIEVDLEENIYYSRSDIKMEIEL